jgi:hypothetical protein
METVLISPEPPQCTSTSVMPSLYDLIEALQDAAGPDGDALVVAAVMQMMASGRLTFPHRVGTSQCN